MSANLALVQQHIAQTFPGAFFVPLPDAARFIGFSQKTVRNKIWRGEPLFPTVERSGKRFVTVDDLARFVAAELDAQAPAPAPAADPAPAPDPAKPRRGRPPRKQAQAEG